MMLTGSFDEKTRDSVWKSGLRFPQSLFDGLPIRMAQQAHEVLVPELVVSVCVVSELLFSFIYAPSLVDDAVRRNNDAGAV